MVLPLCPVRSGGRKERLSEQAFSCVRPPADERDPQKSEAQFYKIKQLTIDRVMYAPVKDLRALMGIGRRVAKHTVTDVWMSPFPSY